MNKIAKYLNQHIVGNVFDRPEILDAYATDRSVLKIDPKMVVIPENTNDVRKTVRFISQLAKKGVDLSLTVRGSGLDKTGADLGSSVILSMEHMNSIQEIDERSRLVRVQAGTKLGDLNQALGLVGLTLPVNANPNETIGSLISNFSADSYSGKYSGIYYYIDCLEAVVSNGDVIQTGRLGRHALNRKKGLTSTEGLIYRELHGLIEDNFDLISDIAAKNTIDDAGYQMLAQVYREKGHSFDLLPLFFAAQGTLGVITEVILRCELVPADAQHFAAAFKNAKEALAFADQIIDLEPREINFYDARIFAKAAASGKDPALFSKKFAKGYILVLSFDDRSRSARRKITKCLKRLPDSAAAVIETEENTSDFEKIPPAYVSYLNDDLRGERAPLLDDFYVPAENLVNFLKTVRTQEEVYDLDLPVSGSLSASNYSIRPDLRLNSVDGRQNAVRLIKDLGSILEEAGGSLTGGSPEGRTKAIFTTDLIPDNELELYSKVKTIFDPLDILNPSVKLGATLNGAVKSLRTSPSTGTTS